MKKILLMMIAIAFLSGCSTGFNCKGVPKGVTCMSAREVYNATEYAQTLGEDASSKNDVATSSVASQNSPMSAAVQGYHQDNPLPIRTPEQVMEIWIAPWEDSQDSLHMASTVYTEIEKRRWTVGESIINSQAQITPLDVRSRSVGSKGKKKPHEIPDLSNVQLNQPLTGEI